METMNNRRALEATLRPGIAPVPHCMPLDRIDHRGFPVPWFVTLKDSDGHWDFVNIEGARWLEALRTNRCWVSGTVLGTHKAFVIGPMCVINRAAGDVPVRRDIAEWAVEVCPFMVSPLAKRSVDRGEVTVTELNGSMIHRNPGVTAIYVTKSFKHVGRGTVHLGDPVSISWHTRGRRATPDEVWASVTSGLPILQRAAVAEGWQAERELRDHVHKALPLMPPMPHGALDGLGLGL